MIDDELGFAIGTSSADVPSTATSTNAANTHTADVPVAPSTKRGASRDVTGQLQLDGEEGVMFCAWCRSFARSDIRNQFISGSSYRKLGSIKKHE